MQSSTIPSLSSRFPTELYESFIDAIDAWEPFKLGEIGQLERHTGREISLRSCSLVSRAWRPRSQRCLFRHVLLTDRLSLRKFVALLDTAPWRRPIVEQLGIAEDTEGYDPWDTFVLSPTALEGRLPRLKSIGIVRGFKEQLRKQGGRKQLPYLPIHPRFPLILSASSFRGVVQLTLSSQLAIFATFLDFTRVLNAFRTLSSMDLTGSIWDRPGLNQFPPALGALLAPESIPIRTIPKSSKRVLSQLKHLTVRSSPSLSFNTLLTIIDRWTQTYTIAYNMSYLVFAWRKPSRSSSCHFYATVMVLRSGATVRICLLTSLAL